MVEKWLSDLCGFGLDSGLSASLMQTLSSYNATANDTIVGIMKNSVFGIGAALMTLFMLLELVSIINRVDGGNGLAGTKIPANLMIKFAVFALFYCNIPTVINGIESVAVYVTSQMSGAIYSYNVGLTSADVTAIAEAIDDLGVLDGLFPKIILMLCWIMVKGIQFILSITVLFRMFEMWLMLLLSPIPLACIASSEFKQTAVNFFKAYAAISLRGAAIVGCFLIYGALFGSNVLSYDSSMAISDFIVDVLLNNLLYILALAAAVFSSGKIVNRILGVF